MTAHLKWLWIRFCLYLKPAHTHTHLVTTVTQRSIEFHIITRRRKGDTWRVVSLSPVQISGETLGGIVFTFKVKQCLVHSKGSCSTVKELPIMMEACSPATCPNSSRLSFSLDQLQELTSTSWDLECSISVCHSKVPTLSSLVCFFPLFIPVMVDFVCSPDNTNRFAQMQAE